MAGFCGVFSSSFEMADEPGRRVMEPQAKAAKDWIDSENLELEEPLSFWVDSLASAFLAFAASENAALLAEVEQLRGENESLRAVEDENRVLKERCFRFLQIARVVRQAFQRDDSAAMKAFGNNMVGHLAARVEREVKDER